VEEAAAAAQSMREQAELLAQAVSVFKLASQQSYAPTPRKSQSPRPAAPGAAAPKPPAPAAAKTTTPPRLAGTASSKDDGWEEF
jgi:methyl-accepting chemotaxis protein